MPKNVPAEFTGRFSIKPKQSRSKLRATPTVPLFEDRSTIHAAGSSPGSRGDEPGAASERKRKKDENRSTSDGASPATSPSLEEDDSLEKYSIQLERGSPNVSHSGDSPAAHGHLGEQSSSRPTWSHRLQHRSGGLGHSDALKDKESILTILTAWTRPGTGKPDVSSTAHRIVHAASFFSNPDDPVYTAQTIVSTAIDFLSDEPRALDPVLYALDEAVKLLVIQGSHDPSAIKQQRTPSSGANGTSRGIISDLTGYVAQVSQSTHASDAKWSLEGPSDSPREPDRYEIARRINGSPRTAQNAEGAVSRIHSWRQKRKSQILATTVQTRCFALRLLQFDGFHTGAEGVGDDSSDDDNTGSNKKRPRIAHQWEDPDKQDYYQQGHREQQVLAHFLTTIRAGLDRTQQHWSKADMVSACMLLRGCAKTLLKSVSRTARASTGTSTSTGTEIESDRMVEQARLNQADVLLQTWKAALEGFVLQDGGDEAEDKDFVVKSHAALALRNLNEGPFDETSEQLFAPETWVF